ncbi:MAG: hypothetical protein H7326_07780 [Bdellovibrionaceae bacterium]|nr:hypothetical protein [Pseudobdellovibrionaceae bacterium]
MKKLKLSFAIVPVLLASSGCQPKKVDDASSATRYLYIQSGGCFAPTGLTASNASKTISRINLTNGTVDRTIVDYTANLTDTPVAIAPLDADNIYVLIENTGGRRVEILNKTSGASQNFLVNGTALTGVVRSMNFASDGSIIISKSSAVERFSSSKTRLPNTGTTFMSAPAGTCATSTNAITATAMTKAGDLMYAHSFSSASANNRIGMTTGSAAAASTCYNGYGSPNIAAFPTAMAYIGSMNHLLVAYSSSTIALNQVMAYTVDETAHTMTQAASAAYSTTSVINGPTAIAYDSATGFVYVANGTTVNANSIEKFTYDPTSQALTRVGTTPFSSATVNHNCINSMFVGI